MAKEINIHIYQILSKPIFRSQPQEPHFAQDDGVIVPATPAMANEDIPDSMQSMPPPPPSCPPPELD